MPHDIVIRCVSKIIKDCLNLKDWCTCHKDHVYARAFFSLLGIRKDSFQCVVYMLHFSINVIAIGWYASNSKQRSNFLHVAEYLDWSPIWPCCFWVVFIWAIVAMFTSTSCGWFPIPPGQSEALVLAIVRYLLPIDILCSSNILFCFCFWKWKLNYDH